MGSLNVLTSALPAGPRRHPWWHRRRWGFNFLTISIAAHILFGLGATYLIVQTIAAKRKQTFAGPPQSPNAPTRAIEHKVQMQKKQQTMSAPAPVARTSPACSTTVSRKASASTSGNWSRARRWRIACAVPGRFHRE